MTRSAGAPRAARRPSPSFETRSAARRASKLCFCLLVFGLCWLGAGAARAADACEEAFASWAARCEKQTGLEVRARHCPPGGVVLAVSRRGEALLDVEVASGDTRGFRRVSGLSLSPVGELGDWKSVAEPTRAAFDALAGCVAADPALPDVRRAPSAAEPSAAPTAIAKATLPWRGLAGLAITCALGVSALRRRARVGLALALVAAASFTLRWLALPHAFFHQNGQGPDWIAVARGGGALSRYGPGYAEVFSLMARAGNTPEGGVFLEQALLASLAPIGAFAILRAAGARAVVAWPITVALAAEPLLARLGVSESYFATGFSLSMLAGATLAMGAARATLRARRFWLSALGAGLLVAQVARVHPLTWLAAACLPLIVVVGPGRLRTRLTLALGSALALGAVTAALSGSALGSVLTGSLGTEWLPAAAGRLRRSWALAPLALALLASLNFLRGRTRRFVVVAATAALVGAALRAGDVLGSPNPAVAGAYVRLFLPAMLAAVAALSRFIRGRHVRHGLALGVAVAAVFWSVSRWRPLTELPTDALEQGFAMGWRETLPRNATVVYLSRANRRSLVLPLYARGMPLSSSNRPPALSALPGAVFYYRSSLCDSAEGRSFCAALEASVRLGPRVERALPARASMRWDSYLETPVRVALFRVIREP